MRKSNQEHFSQMVRYAIRRHTLAWAKGDHKSAERWYFAAERARRKANSAVIVRQCGHEIGHSQEWSIQP
jgi:hypothetical protein